MKKGFTLVEILGVVAILAIITMVATPSIISMIKNANSKMKSAEDQTIIAAAEKYVVDNPNKYSLAKTNDPAVPALTVTATTLVNAKYLDANLLAKSSYYKNYFQVNSTGKITKDTIIVTITITDLNKSMSAVVTVK